MGAENKYKSEMLYKEERKEMFYLTMHSAHFMVIWHGTYGKGPFRYKSLKENLLLPLYGLLLAAMYLLYAPSDRHDKTQKSLCYTSGGALAGTGNRSVGKMVWRRSFF